MFSRLLSLQADAAMIAVCQLLDIVTTAAPRIRQAAVPLLFNKRVLQTYVPARCLDRQSAFPRLRAGITRFRSAAAAIAWRFLTARLCNDLLRT